MTMTIFALVSKASTTSSLTYFISQRLSHQTVLSFIRSETNKNRQFSSNKGFPNIGNKSTCRQPPYSFLLSQRNNDEGSDTSSNNRTRYTIDDTVCAPTDPDKLRTVVEKHCRTLDRYIANKPLAKHTVAAYDLANNFINEFYNDNSITATTDSVDKYQVIMDSGCGTAKSTILLGNRYPNNVVIGIDRSLVRLNRNAAFRKHNNKTAASTDPISFAEDFTTSEVIEDKTILSQSIPNLPNVLLLRAELSDFWRCYLQSSNLRKWNVQTHYLLYPNPYPKTSRLKNRWYAHPSFPILLHMFGATKGAELVVRSNWEGYLTEFSNSLGISQQFFLNDKGENASGDSSTTTTEDDIINTATFNVNTDLLMNTLAHGPMKLSEEDLSIPMTNFEKKFADWGEPVYELRLTREG